MTLIVMYLSVKFNVKSKFILIPVGILLIFATVYLRYHYFIDLAGGFILMVFTMWSGYYIYNGWQRFTGCQEIHIYKNTYIAKEQHVEENE
jgi:membrane-associated phospholipid phosphatase